MPRTTLALTSFIAGEFSPKLDGRTDFEKYSSGCKTLENMLVHPQGAATRRVGTQFIAEVKTSSAKTRLIPFEFSTTQTYIIEAGNTYFRFYKDKGQILLLRLAQALEDIGVVEHMPTLEGKKMIMIIAIVV